MARTSKGAMPLPKEFQGAAVHYERLLASLQGSPDDWNNWRREHPSLRPDLRTLDLAELDSDGRKVAQLDLRRADLRGARLSGIRAWQIRLAGADLRSANLDHSDLSFASLRAANLGSCRLVNTNLSLVDARDASFVGSVMTYANLNGADLRGTNLSGARVSGVSTWNIRTDSQTRQSNMILEDIGDFLEEMVSDSALKDSSAIGHVDHLEAVYLIDLLRDKAKFKTVIDAMTSKVVLILGNFNRRRLAVLRDIERALAAMGYVPVVFDFDKPNDRDLIETVALLAGLSSFVIADLTHPRSTPLEAMLVLPNLRVPFVSIIEKGELPFGMFQALQDKYGWALPTWTYPSRAALVRQIRSRIVEPAEAKRREFRRLKVGP